MYETVPTPPPAVGLDPARARLTARGAYRAFLRGDGQIVHARVVGGMRSQAFDMSVLAAIDSLNANGGVAMVGDDGVHSPQDSVDLHITVGTSSYWPSGSSATPIPADGSVPLFEYRTPARRATRAAGQMPGNRAPRYPVDMRNAHVDGIVRARFIILATGEPDMSSVEILSATNGQFAGAVVTALPAMRFRAMEIAGCPVASFVYMPFEFNVVGH